MRRIFYKCSVLILLGLFIMPVQAQPTSTEPPAGVVNFLKGLPNFQVPVRMANGSNVPVWKVGDRFVYLPVLKAGWAKYRSDVESVCGDETPPEQLFQVWLHVEFYSDSLINDIYNHITKQGESVTPGKILYPPFISYSIFAELDGATRSIYDSIEPSHLIAGSRRAQVGTFPRFKNIRLVLSCDDHQELHSIRAVQAGIFAVSNTYKSNTISTIASFAINSQMLKDLKNDESEIDRTTTNSRGGGSGFSIKVGKLFAGGSSSSTSSTTVSRENKRMVSRNWLTDQKTKMISNIEQRAVCEIASDCTNTILQSRFDSFMDDSFKPAKAQLKKQADGLWVLTVDGVRQPAAELQVTDGLNGTLNHILNNESEEEGSYGEYKFKKKDDRTITLNDSINWSRSGDDWVPTDFDAYIVDVYELETKLRQSYSKVLLDEAANFYYTMHVIEEMGSEYNQSYEFIGTSAGEYKQIRPDMNRIYELCDDLYGCRFDYVVTNLQGEITERRASLLNMRPDGFYRSVDLFPRFQSSTPAVEGRDGKRYDPTETAVGAHISARIFESDHRVLEEDGAFCRFHDGDNPPTTDFPLGEDTELGFTLDVKEATCTLTFYD